MAGGIRPELIPIKKSVVDLTKGVILRTYYMRPDKLKRLINDLKTEPIKQYTGKILKKDDVERIVTTGKGDASAFSNFFPDGKKEEFNSIIQRSHIKDSIYDTNPSCYNVVRCCQLLTAYVISVQDMYLVGFKNTVKDAMKNYELKVTENETVIKTKKPKEKKKKNPEDQIEFIYPTKFIELEEQIDRNQIPENFPKNIGDTIQTNLKTKLIKYTDSKKTGIQLSRFINFIHPTPNKMSTILSKLVDKNYRNNEYLIHNLILLPELYEKKQFISELIASIIYDSSLLKSTKSEDVDFNFDLYKYILLNQIDTGKFNEIHKTYSNEKLEYTLPYLNGDKNIIDLLSESVLNTEEKSTVVLSLNTKLITKNLKKIRDFIAKENADEDIYLISCLLDSLLCRRDMNNEVCNTLISEVEKSRNIKIFTLDNMLYEAVNTKIYDIEPTYNYLFLQSMIAKYLGNFYIPYDIAYKIGGLPYSTFVVTKIFNNIYPNFKKELDIYIANNKIHGVEKQKELFMPVLTNEDLKDLDNQTFIRVDPLEVLYETPPKDTKYISIKLPTDKICKFVSPDGNVYYIVLDMIKHIIM